MKALFCPFGATGAVYGFNRPSFAMRVVLLHAFRFLVTSFFDDFPTLEFAKCASVSGDVMIRAFKVFGFLLSLDKLLEYKPQFVALGVQFDLFPVTCKGSLIVVNTDKRKKSITAEIDSRLSVGTMSSHEAASLKGRTTYSEAQHWGRVGSLTMNHLTFQANGGNFGLISPELRKSLLLTKWITEFAPPRSLNPWSKQRCNVIFVDGAAEGENKQEVSFGAVLFSPLLDRPQFFGLKASKELVAYWQGQGSKQVICQAEIFPVILAKRTWRKILYSCRNLWFIDNEGAREGFVKSYSTSWSARELLLLGKLEDARSDSLDWYSRVPTAANWADTPSRLDFSKMNEIGAVQVRSDVPSLEEIKDVDAISELKRIVQ